MTPAKPKLRVTPELCDGCGPGKRDCERACKESAIRAGSGFVYVDWERCNGCLACVEMCESGALKPREGAVTAPPSSTPAPRPRVLPANSAVGTSPMSVWTEADGLIALLVMLGSLVVLNMALNLKVVALMPASGRVFARVAGLTLAYALELVVISLLAKRHGVRLGPALGLRPVVRSFRSAVVSALLVVGLLVAARLLTTVYGLVTHALEWEPIFRWNTDLTRVFGHGWVGLSLTVALVVFGGPFVEELTFRGVVQPAARRRWGVPASILASSVLFATYHFDPWMFAPTLVLSVALGWLAENRKGLWPSIALHVLYNGITVAAVFWVAWAQGM